MIMGTGMTITVVIKLVKGSTLEIMETITPGKSDHTDIMEFLTQTQILTTIITITMTIATIKKKCY